MNQMTQNTTQNTTINFFENNWKLLALGLGAFIIIGLVWAIASGNSKRKEITAQEDYVTLDEQFNKYKEQKATLGADPKAEIKDKVDVASLKTNLQNFVNQNTGTVASQIAALSLSDILLDENNQTEALSLLKKTESNSNLLSNVLIRKKTGQILADSNQCKEAIAVWDKIITDKKTEYVQADVKIKQALCYQKLNDFKKAEEILTAVKNNRSEGQQQISAEADRILRLLQHSKASGS